MVKEELFNLFGAIEQGKLTRAKCILHELKATIGTDPDLVKADVLIQRKEILGE